MGLLDSVSRFVDPFTRPIIERIEDVLGIEHSAPTPSAPAAGTPETTPVPPSNGPTVNPIPNPPAGTPVPPAVRLNAASGSVPPSQDFEFNRFIDTHERRDVERAVRQVLGLRDDQPLPGPINVEFTVGIRMGMGTVGTVRLRDVGFRLPPNVTRDQLEAAVQHAINCNPIPGYAIPSASFTDVTTPHTLTVGGKAPAPVPPPVPPTHVS